MTASLNERITSMLEWRLDVVKRTTPKVVLSAHWSDADLQEYLIADGISDDLLLEEAREYAERRDKAQIWGWVFVLALLLGMGFAGAALALAIVGGYKAVSTACLIIAVGLPTTIGALAEKRGGLNDA